MSAPSPALLAGTRSTIVTSLKASTPAIDPEASVVKAKHLQPGQRVQAWLHGGPKGGAREVESVTRVEGGAFVEITWASGQPASTVKAAYRYFDLDA